MTLPMPVSGQFNYREPALILKDIIMQSLGLSVAQIMLSNQKVFIPTNGPFVVLRYLGPGRVISNVDEWSDIGGDFTEIQTMTIQHTIQIQILSYDSSAFNLKEQIIFAINSLLSQSQQELWNINIARHPSPFLDTSYFEDTGMVTCYTTTVQTVSVLQKQLPVLDYYNDFSRSVPPVLVENA